MADDSVKRGNIQRLWLGTFRVDIKKTPQDSACGITFQAQIDTDLAE